MNFIGIDNGLNGGIVILDNNQNILNKFVMPIIKVNGKTEYDIGRLCQIFDIEGREYFAVLEKSHIRPVCGKRSCFNLGYGYGIMQALLESNGIGYVIVSPQKWMKEILGNIKQEGKGSILFCQRRWPNEKWTATDRSVKPHDGITDATCIALYGLKFLNENKTEDKGETK